MTNVIECLIVNVSKLSCSPDPEECGRDYGLGAAGHAAVSSL